MVRNFSSFLIMLFYVFFYDIIKVKHSGIVSIMITCLFFPFCAYVSIELIDCILLSSFEIKAMFLISSLKKICLSLLNRCCVFNICLFSPSLRKLHQFLCFLNSLLHSQFEMLLNSFHNPEICVLFLQHTFLSFLSL